MPRKPASRKKDATLSDKNFEEVDTNQVLALIPLLPYHVIADYRCGPGHFAIALGKHVFYGKVYAIDARQGMLDATREKMEKVRLTNLELKLSRRNKLPLEDDSLDGVFAGFAVHESADVKGLLKETRRCLKNGGWLALLEWQKRELGGGPPLDKRIDESDLRELTQSAGFRFTSRHSLNDRHYLLLTRK